jgi:RimJ/RimL family protein N-acetyltransferase
MAECNTIKTKRLELISLNRILLGNFLDQEDLFFRELGPASRLIITPIIRKAIRMKLSKMDQSSPEELPWITYWLIRVPPEGFGAGLIGFKGLPDQNGVVEVGYGIDPEFRNLGYTTEALQGLIRWAFEDQRCRRIIAPDTLRSNLASNRVLEKVGMFIYAETPETLSWCIEKKDLETRI